MSAADRSTVVDPFRGWDAAYLLGSLSAAERREFEVHLEECSSCVAAVAELAGLPGLLSKVSADDAAALLGDEEATGPAPSPPPTLLPRLVHSVRSQRRRRMVSAVAGLAVVAAAIVLVVPLLFPAAAPASAPSGARAAAELSLSQVSPSPLRASIRLVPQAWGTRIEMDCHYAAASATPGYGAAAPAGYAMWVTDAAGHATQVATWTAGPGQDAEPAGTTGLTVKQIAAVDVRSTATGAILLRGSP